MADSYESLRKENIKAVFYAVADYKCATRAEIFSHTGISVVTVGKAVEEFLDRGVFIQRASQKKTVGRHANRVLINRTKQFVIIDISNRNFEFRCIDLSFNHTYSWKYEYIDDFDYADNICAFLYRVKAYMLKNKKNHYFANYFISSGVYDKHSDKILNSGDADLERLNIQTYIKKRTGMSIHKIINKTAAAVKYCQSICPPDKNILYLYVNNDFSIRARVIIDRKAPRELIGEDRKNHGVNVCEFVADFIADICAVIRISKVYIESNAKCFYMNVRGIKELLYKDRFIKNESIPKVIYNCDVPFSQLGGAEHLRELWLDNLMK